jgi:DNA-binding beta-propeller fold protein YncE
MFFRVLVRCNAYLGVASFVILSIILLATVSSVSLALNPSPVSAVIKVGSEPFSLLYDSEQGKIFVANGGDGTASVISDSSNSVVAVLEFGSKWGPGSNGLPQLAYDSRKGEILAMNGVANHYVQPTAYPATPATLISDSNYSTIINFGSPGGGSVVYDSSQDAYFMSSQSDTYFGRNSLLMVPASNLYSSNPVSSTAPVGSNPASLAYDPGKGEIFVVDRGDSSSMNNGNVTVVSDISSGGHNLVVSTINVGGALGPGIAYDPGRGELFVSDNNGGQGFAGLAVISDTSNQVVARINLNIVTTGVAYDSSRDEILAVGIGGNSSATYGVLEAISDANESVVWTQRVGGACFTAVCSGQSDGPSDIVYDSAEGAAFVANSHDDSVYVVPDPALPVTMTSPGQASATLSTSVALNTDSASATSEATPSLTTVPPITISVLTLGSGSQGTQTLFPITLLVGLAAAVVLAVAIAMRKRRRHPGLGA